jgi:hypothetical protein
LLPWNVSSGLTASGTLSKNASSNIPYTVSLGNVAGRNMQAFSGTNATMRGVDGQFYPDFQIFFDYYGRIDYAEHYILSALNGAVTTFTNGNANFTGKAFIGRNRKEMIFLD